METIFYENFTGDSVFESPQLNVLFNQMFSYLSNVFSVAEIEENFVLDKKAALSLYGVTFNSIETVDFTITSEQIFRLFSSTVEMLDVVIRESSKTNLTLDAFGYILSFSLNLGDVERVKFKNLTVRDRNDIIL